MSGPTPGPWVVARVGVNGFIYVRASSPHGRTIAKLPRPGTDGAIAGDKGFDRETRLANARLIAAAPELLAAVRPPEEFLDFVERWPMEPYEVDAYCGATLVPAMRRWLAEARAAIAKAEGRP